MALAPRYDGALPVAEPKFCLPVLITLAPLPRPLEPLCQVGAPFLITSSTGTLSQTAFGWVTIDLTGNAFGTLASGTRYWVGLLPGATFSPPAGGSNGIQWGGFADKRGPGPLSGNGKLYTAVQIRSQASASDTAYGCAKPAALARLASASNWAMAVAGSYEDFRGKAWTTSVGVLRHGAILYGTTAAR